MTHVNPTRAAEEIQIPESYPTFWDAIPVDTASEREPEQPIAIQYQDAYAAFTDATEDGGTGLLSVEQSDVGQL